MLLNRNTVRSAGIGYFASTSANGRVTIYAPIVENGANSAVTR